MYSLVTTPGYEIELAQIGPEHGIQRELESTLYPDLRARPELGQPTRAGGYLMRRRLVMGLLLVQVYYTIDVTSRTVRLVSIRAIDQTRL